MHLIPYPGPVISEVDILGVDAIRLSPHTASFKQAFKKENAASVQNKWPKDSQLG